MNKDKLTVVLFSIIGISLLFSSIFLTYRSIKVITTYETAEGVVIDFQEQLKKDKDTGRETLLYAPIYEYQDKKGNTYKVNSGEYSSSKSYSAVRQKIYYEKDFPDMAITGMFQLYIVPCISIVFCLICFLVVYFARKPSVI
ncbi:DUF3592 domain-containing protein [Chryseobacterium sp. ERMR1:04]|uniref:DUF3592 domain-containing protein n=1 Tax=Chryseobacterium sp. ERMR1:04 TaxID=1705393 RepID=UPI0006C89719|nr:DUF3592 domain-containing protein [Chryseobacterium sp. ERMR1:04]KPH13469.1 hypothetical protein AMQ68_07750 [Chryseobacterium sp. ERMR1:04]